jgi:hypothetical protein
VPIREAAMAQIRQQRTLAARPEIDDNAEAND